MDGRLKALMSYGLKGVEAFYSGFNTALIRENLAFAEKYGLFVTAGSDYHGTNKTVTLGMDVGDEEVFIAPLLAALAKRGSHFVQ